MNGMSQHKWVAITVPVAQTLGPGMQMRGSLTTSHKHGYEWCIILPQTTVIFPGNPTDSHPLPSVRVNTSTHKSRRTLASRRSKVTPIA